MTVLLDTGPLVAYLNRQDPRHEQAQLLLESVWRGIYGPPLGIDAVMDEGATLLRRRPGRKGLSERFLQHFFPPPGEPAAVRLVLSDEVLLRNATLLHLKFYDVGLSFTDCLLAAHAERVGGVVATFDGSLRAVATTVDGPP